MSEEVPSGAVQAISTGASALVVVTAAFMGWWAFGTDAEWTWGGLGVFVLAGLALLCLAAVPFMAAGAESLRKVKRVYAVGAILFFVAFCWGVTMTFGADDEGEADDTSGTVSCPPAFPRVELQRDV
jgi:hypothetical protein